MKPLFTTFTGLDENTDITRLLSISDEHDCEFGILFSRNQQGKSPRYPSMEWVEHFLDVRANHVKPVRLSAHICGSYARDIMEGNFETGLPLSRFTRAQVNHVSPQIEVLEDFARHIDKPVIAQWRDDEQFSIHSSLVQWLFDPSGGRGQSADRWPVNMTGELVGYSGGINPENVTEMMHRAVSPRYWIDMENGVRTDDYLDLDKVERVLAAVEQASAANV